MDLKTCYEVLRKVDDRSASLSTKQLEQASVWLRNHQEFQTLLTVEQWNEFLDAQKSASFKYSVVAKFCGALLPDVRGAWLLDGMAPTWHEKESPPPPKV